MLPSCLNWNDSFVFQKIDSDIAGSFAAGIGITGFCLNSIIICAALSYPQLRYHVTTPFILSLTTSDLLFSSLTLPLLSIRFFYEKWIVGEFLCRIFPLIFYGNSAATLLSLLAVTINRWVMVYFPNKSSQIFSRGRTKCMVLLCWIFPILLLCPSLFGIWGHHGLECHTQSCTIQETNGSSPKILFLLIGLVLPTIILLVANTMIFVKVYMVRQKMANYSAVPSKALKKREQKLTRMMCIIFFCFILSYYPGVLIKVLDDDEAFPRWHIVTYIVNWLSVILNPLIYVISNEKYRLAIEKLFLRCSRNPRSIERRIKMEEVHSSVSDVKSPKARWKMLKDYISDSPSKQDHKEKGSGAPKHTDGESLVHQATQI